MARGDLQLLEWGWEEPAASSDFSLPGYQAPDKIDSKFFDPKYAFKEVEVQTKSVSELVSKKKPKVRIRPKTQMKLGIGAKDILISKVMQENESSGDAKWWKSQFWGGLQPQKVLQ